MNRVERLCIRYPNEKSSSLWRESIMYGYQDARAYFPLPTPIFLPPVQGGGPSMQSLPSMPGGPGTGGMPQNITPPPPQLLNSYQQLSQSPAQAQNFVQQQTLQGTQGAVSFAAGCQNRWTLIVTKTFNVFLMYVTQSNPNGFTRGFIYPTYAFGTFPSSVILWYSCF